MFDTVHMNHPIDWKNYDKVSVSSGSFGPRCPKNLSGHRRVPKYRKLTVRPIAFRKCKHALGETKRATVTVDAVVDCQG